MRSAPHEVPKPFPQRLLVAGLLALLVSACATTGSNPPPAPAQARGEPAAGGEATGQAASPTPGSPRAELPPVDLDGRMLFGIVSSEIALQRGELRYAYTELMRLARETRDPRLARRATEVALGSRALPQALDAAALWHEISPGDPEAETSHASMLLIAGRYDEARPLLEHQLAASANPAGLLDQLGRMLAKGKDPGAGLDLLEALAKKIPADPSTTFNTELVLARSARDAGKAERAAAHARAALALRPDSEAAAVGIANALADGEGPSAHEGRAEAISLLDGFLARHEDANDARLARARALVAESRIEQARAGFEELLRHKPDSPDAHFALGALALDAERYAEARPHFERYLELAASDPEREPDLAYLNLARVAEGEHRYEDALAWLHKVKSPGQAGNAREREAFVLAHLDRVDEGMRLLEAMPLAGDEDRTRVVLAQAQILRDAHRYQQSFDLLEGALKDHPDDTSLLYESAMSAERLDRIEIMEKRLRRVLALAPEAAHAYNALGYTLADRNIRLQEAYDLIRRALTLAPDDGFIVDSLGWVQFRLGRLDAARESLQRAYRLKADPDVAAHLGEVLWALGDRAAARELLLDASRRDGESDTLRETLGRLKIQP